MVTNNNMEEKAINPPSLSANSRRNAYYHFCAQVGERRNFSACIARLEGRCTLGDCKDPIRNGTCPAKAMREDELLKGQAIYFVERANAVKFVEGVKQFASEQAERFAQQAPSNAPTPDLHIAPDGYAEAVNRMVERGQVRVQAPKKIELLPGETLLEAARRMRQQKKQ